MSHIYSFCAWSIVNHHSTFLSYNEGELYDPETNPLKKFKKTQVRRPKKDSISNKEFFKWLGNLPESDHRKFYEHVFNKSGDNQVYAYPKVTIKTISLVLISCYNAKEWIEQRKRK
jgi:hypothetical protein